MENRKRSLELDIITLNIKLCFLAYLIPWQALKNILIKSGLKNLKFLLLYI